MVVAICMLIDFYSTRSKNIQLFYILVQKWIFNFPVETYSTAIYCFFFLSFFFIFENNFHKTVSISVGCVTHSCQQNLLLWPPLDVSTRGKYAMHEMYPPLSPPPCGQTDACKNITSPKFICWR